MTTTPSPTPGGKPWRKSETPGHTPKHAPEKKEGAGEKVKKAAEATRDAIGKASMAVEKPVEWKNVPGKAVGAVSSTIGKHTRKFGALALAAFVAGGIMGYQHRQTSKAEGAKAAAAERESVVPKKRIVVDVTIQVQDGKIKIKPKGETRTDQCGKAHTVTAETADAEEMRKGRMRASGKSVRFTVEAHGETYTYEADDDVVADGEERESTISAHLVSGEETHE